MTRQDAERELENADQSIGQRRVGVAFNPSRRADVDVIKGKAAELVDYLRYRVPDWREPEAVRCRAIAEERIEEAAMWAVKAVTKTREGPE